MSHLSGFAPGIVEGKRRDMVELLRKVGFLLCFIALLSLVAPPVSALGDHPWDDSSDNTGNTDPDDSGQGGSDDQVMTGYDVYLGPEGLFQFIGDTFAFYYRVIITDSGKDGKTVRPENRSMTASQSKG
ncbi:MAG: hypothetical protein ACE5GA_00330 [Candidatus Zixiibacteriota bacterium]